MIQRHAALLGLLFIVGGFIGLLVGVPLVAAGIGAVAIASSSDPAVASAAGTTAVVFIALGLAGMLWASLNVIVGRGLRRPRRWSRRAALLSSAVNLFLIPFGTALAIYATWLLLNNDARTFFRGLDGGARPPESPTSPAGTT
ncbi:MAG: hypothetical protein U0Q12_18985 [Vicinamibacterales bacterium]